MNKTLSALLLSLTFSSLCFAGGGGWDFTDVPKGHENYDAINYYRDAELFFGDDGEDGFAKTFRPDDPVNRAELAAILYRVKAGKHSTLASSEFHDCFPDVAQEWFAPYICWAKDMGHIEGYKAGEKAGMYGPADNVTIGELLALVSRYNNWELPQVEQDDTAWYQGPMAYANNLNIIDNQTFDKVATRGEVAEVMYRNAFDGNPPPYVPDNGPVQEELPDTVPAGADEATYEQISYHYGKDKDHVYYEGEIMDNLDPATFIVFPERYYPLATADLAYTKDANAAYYNQELIEEADAKTFFYLNIDLYAQDMNNFYYAGEPLNVDYDTYQVVNFSVAKDKDHVYFDRVIVEGADVDTFEAVYSPYYKDKDHIFYKDTIMPEADVATFETFLNYYAKDVNNVYYNDQIMSEADPATFEYISGQYAKDKNYVYSYGEIMPDTDPETFTVSK